MPRDLGTKFRLQSSGKIPVTDFFRIFFADSVHLRTHIKTQSKRYTSKTLISYTSLNKYTPQSLSHCPFPPPPRPNRFAVYINDLKIISSAIFNILYSPWFSFIINFWLNKLEWFPYNVLKYFSIYRLSVLSFFKYFLQCIRRIVIVRGKFFLPENNGSDYSSIIAWTKNWWEIIIYV